MDDVRGRLDPLSDFELWFWMCMGAGTHAINAALHHVGATDGGDYCCTQSLDVYLEPAGEGAWKPALRFGCDIIHVGMPEVDAPLPVELARACTAMMVLEELRDPCIRGNRAITPDVVARVDAAYRDCLALTQQVIEQPPAAKDEPHVANAR